MPVTHALPWGYDPERAARMEQENQERTTTELLDGLHASNTTAWNDFDRRYRPILVGFLHRMGLGHADAADVAQETLARFVRDYRRNMYDRRQGRLRTWLIAIARHRIADLRRAAARRGLQAGTSVLATLSDGVDAEAAWDAEQRGHIFNQAIRELRAAGRFQERTIEAFERVMLRQEPVEQVADDLGLTPQEIYNAKHRVVQRLRSIVQRYEIDLGGGDP